MSHDQASETTTRDLLAVAQQLLGEQIQPDTPLMDAGLDSLAVTELARKWSSLLQSTGMDAAFSLWKDDQIAFETKHEGHVKEITDFCLQQPEAALVPSMDVIVKKLLAADGAAAAPLLEKAKEAAAKLGAKDKAAGDFYVKAMGKYVEKGADYPVAEVARLQKMIDGVTKLIGFEEELAAGASAADIEAKL